MDTSDIAIVIGELLGSFGIGLAFGYVLAVWKQGAKTSFQPK